MVRIYTYKVPANALPMLVVLATTAGNVCMYVCTKAYIFAAIPSTSKLESENPTARHSEPTWSETMPAQLPQFSTKLPTPNIALSIFPQRDTYVWRTSNDWMEPIVIYSDVVRKALYFQVYIYINAWNIKRRRMYKLEICTAFPYLQRYTVKYKNKS